MRLPYQTLRDSSLEHQVVLYTNREQSEVIMVSCNCNKVPNEGKPGNMPYISMGVAKNLDDTKALYNDPALHCKPFDVEKWGLKW